MADQETAATILLVDSQSSVTTPVRGLLEILDHVVYVAHSGGEALEQLQAHRDEIDIVILDLKMPDMHGVECLDQLRQLRPELPAILATGYVVEQDLRQRVAPRIQAQLAKPFTPDRLIDTIQEILADAS